MKKKLISIGLFGTIAVMIIGCSGGAAGDKTTASKAPSGSADMAGLEVGKAADGTTTKADGTQISVPRRIIYTGDIHLACDNLDTATQKLESRIKEFGAYISSGSRTGSRGSIRESTWTIRLPAEKFDSFIKFTVALGELQSNTRQAQDVSEEYYDVDARLKNKKIEEARLVELLKKATGKLSEILTVEKELTRVREEAERIEGRLRFLQNQTDLSTLTVTIQEIKNFQPEGPPTAKTQVSRTFEGSIDLMKQLAFGVLLFFVAVLPWAIPILVILWIIVQRNRKPAPKAEPKEEDHSV